MLSVLVLTPARAAFPGPNGKITFSSTRDGNGEVYVMNADGTGAARLTTDPADDITPAFSPDASKIAFWTLRSGTGDIYVMDADGSNETNLTNTPDPEFEPAFSPDGSKIAYARNPGVASDIFTMNADGSSPTNLTNNPAIDTDPAFSPDGTKIAFARSPGNVFVMNADGSGQTALTNTGLDGAPSFSPDGTRIVFLSLRDGNDEIYVMNADGTNETNVSNDPAADSQPAFSPDGTKIIFDSDRSGDRDLWIMNADGSSPVNVTNSPGTDQQADWAVGPAATTNPSGGSGGSGASGGSGGGSASAATPGNRGSSSSSNPGSLVPATVRPPLPPAIAPTPIAGAGAAGASSSGRGSSSRAAAGLGPLPGKGLSAPAQGNAGGSSPAGAGDLVNDNPERSDVVALFSRPDELFLSAPDIGRSIGIAVLLALLLGLPAKLFNKTVQKNRVELAAWFAPLRAAFAAITPRGARRLLGAAVVSVAATTAVYVFLDPAFPGRPGAGAYAAGMLAGFAVIAANQHLTQRVYINRRVPELAGGWKVYPGQVTVSVLCVLASRLAHFVPGVMFGMSGDYESRRPLPLEHLGRRITLTYGLLLAISLTAWCASIPVAHAAAERGASFGVLMLDAALAILAVGGMQGIAFGLVPLTFLDGDSLARARPWVWRGLWGSGLLWLAVVVINPALTHQGHKSASVTWLVALLAFQSLVAVGLWSYFVVRRRGGSSAHAGAHA